MKRCKNVRQVDYSSKNSYMGGHGNKVTKGFFLKAKYSILHYFLPKFDVKNVENTQNSQKLYNLLCSKKKKIWTSGLVTISLGQTGQI